MLINRGGSTYWFSIMLINTYNLNDYFDELQHLPYITPVYEGWNSIEFNEKAIALKA